MLGLRHQVRCNERRLALVAKNQSLGRTRQKIDGAIKSHNFLRSGHKQISRPDDLVYSGNAFRAVSQGRNCLRAADAIELTHSQQRCRRQRRLRRTRRNHSNVLHARDLRRNHGHQQGRGQGIASAGNVTSNRAEGRTNWPSVRPCFVRSHCVGFCHWQKLRMLAAAALQAASAVRGDESVSAACISLSGTRSGSPDASPSQRSAYRRRARSPSRRTL